MSAAAHAIVMAQQCRLCGKHRSPREFVHDAVIGYCWHCYEWHLEALRVLAGGIPKGCQECGASFDALERRAKSPDVRMVLHVKDGIYQLLCGWCSDTFEAKCGQFDKTPYGAAKKLDVKT